MQLPGALVSIEELAVIRRAIYRTIAIDRADADPAGGAGGDGRRRLPGQGAGHARPHARHRSLQCRDRAGQAGRPADPRAGPDRLPSCLSWRSPRLLGGIDPLALVGSFLVAIGCAFVGCSLAMVLSVYGRKTHEVLIMTYILIVLWITGAGPAGNPRAVDADADARGGLIDRSL